MSSEIVASRKESREEGRSLQKLIKSRPSTTGLDEGVDPATTATTAPSTRAERPKMLVHQSLGLLAPAPKPIQLPARPGKSVFGHGSLAVRCITLFLLYPAIDFFSSTKGRPFSSSTTQEAVYIIYLLPAVTCTASYCLHFIPTCVSFSIFVSQLFAQHCVSTISHISAQVLVASHRLAHS